MSQATPDIERWLRERHQPPAVIVRHLPSPKPTPGMRKPSPQSPRTVHCTICEEETLPHLLCGRWECAECGEEYSLSSQASLSYEQGQYESDLRKGL